MNGQNKGANKNPIFLPFSNSVFGDEYSLMSNSCQNISSLLQPRAYYQNQIFLNILLLTNLLVTQAKSI
jgi:hypothetical protein